MGSFKVLLVEDYAPSAELVRSCLEREGLRVVVAQDGPSGEAAFRREGPHLVILDLMLPGLDGIELCRRIRQESTLPVLMLTARSEDTDKAVGLGVGADDYLVKPFSPTELIARVKALLRRSYQYNDKPRAQVIGGPRLLLDLGRRQAQLDGRPLALTTTEFDLLQALVSNPGWVFTRNHLLEKVWGFHDDAGEATVTAHMSNLRAKLGDGGAVIRTVRGVGYAYQEET
jgi:DNA-binding response OmpR family regulator